MDTPRWTVRERFRHAQLPAAAGGTQANGDWNATSGVAQILNKPALAPSAATDATNAGNVTSGTLAAARVPAALRSTTSVNGTPIPENSAFAAVATSGSASDLTAGQLPHAQIPSLLSGDIPNNAADTSGNAATATALAAAPALCATGNYSRGIDASGTAQGCTSAPSLAVSEDTTAVWYREEFLPTPSYSTMGYNYDCNGFSHQDVLGHPGMIRCTTPNSPNSYARIGPSQGGNSYSDRLDAGTSYTGGLAVRRHREVRFHGFGRDCRERLRGWAAIPLQCHPA
jgi:hypothetical protein